MQNVLLLVHRDDGQEARIEAALDIVRAMGGHIECLDVAIPPHPMGDYFGSEAGESLLADEHAREATKRKHLEQRFTSEGISWSWTDLVGYPTDALAQRADLADLIVVPSSRVAGREDFRNLAGKVSRKTGRLVLAVPPSAHGFKLDGIALIAWEGSHEADNALRGAVPFLREASQVVLIDIGPDGKHSVSSAEAYLVHHDIHPRIELVELDKARTIASMLLERAHAIKADHIVMGAFHHSLATEVIFGGVTRSMLEQCDLPLLIAH